MQEKEIIERFKKKGFNHLTLEDLATVQQSSIWNEAFKSSTGEDWGPYSEKATERLSHANFNIKWMTRGKSSFSGLFSAVLRGDIGKLLEFLKSSDLNLCKKAVDNNNKSVMHIAAREGHIEILRILIEKGWEIDICDKHMTTPLHQACNAGHSECISFLLENNANVSLQDSLGRNALLYSVCAPDTECVVKLLEYKKELITSKDFTGRCALHYSVFNPHPRHCEIMKVLVENGLSIDTTDDELKSALHHACESGKAKAIRWLVKWGANPHLKDRNGQIPMDLAANNNVKKLMGLCGIQEKTTKSLNELGAKSIKINGKVGYKEKLLEMLFQVQEAGINNKQHVKKPQLYTGNWMEGVISPIALFNELSYCTPSEAVLKVFNVLFPYTKMVPAGKDSEVIMDEFFGGSYTKTRNETPIYITDLTQVSKYSNESENFKKTIVELRGMLSEKEKIIVSLEEKCKKEAFESEKARELLKFSKEKLEKNIEENSPKKEKNYIEDQMSELKLKLEKAEKKISEYADTSYRLEKELDSRPTKEDLNEALEKLANFQVDNHNLRYRSGQIFLRGLENIEESESVGSEIHLQDIEVLKRLEANLQKKPPSLKARLMDIDSNKDGKISKAEAAKLFSNLEMAPQDSIVLVKILGFRKGLCSVPIETFLSQLEGIDAKAEKMKNDLFWKVKNKFKENSFEIAVAFDYLDVNHDGSVSFAEFSEGVDGLRLNINREEKHAIFSVLDSDHNGSIHLHELQEKLEGALSGPVEKTRAKKVLEKAPEVKKVLEKSPEVKKVLEEEKALKSSVVKEKASKKLNGSLVIGVIKGKGFGPGNFLIQIHLDGSEKDLKTPIIKGPDPEWKYKGRIRLYDTPKSQIANEISLEVQNDKGLYSTCKIAWDPVLDFPNIWAVKREYELLDLSKQAKGKILVHLMWVPKDLPKKYAFGNLGIIISNYSGFPKSLIQFHLKNSVVFNSLSPGQEIVIHDIEIKENEQVPMLKCTILKQENKEVIIWRNLSIVNPLSSNDWSEVLNVPLEESKELGLKFKWMGFSDEEIIRIKAAVKIQACFRGSQVRKGMIGRSPGKVLRRVVVKSEKKYFLVDFVKKNEETWICLHAVDEKIPLFEVVDQKIVGEIDVEEVAKKVAVVKGKLVLENVKEIKADNIGKIQVSGRNKPIARKVVKSNGRYYIVTITDQGENIKIALNLADDNTLPMYNQISHKILKKIPIEQVFATLEITPSHEIQFKPNVNVKNPEKSVINPKETLNSDRKFLLFRKVVKQNSRYYLVSIFDLEKDLKITVHLADDLKIPLFQCQSQVITPKIPVENLMKCLEITKTHQIKLAGIKADEVKITKKLALIARKVLKSNSNYYIVSVFEESKEYLIKANIANEKIAPMYETISSLTTKKIPVSELFSKLKFSKNHEISLE